MDPAFPSSQFPGLVLRKESHIRGIAGSREGRFRGRARGTMEDVLRAKMYLLIDRRFKAVRGRPKSQDVYGYLYGFGFPGEDDHRVQAICVTGYQDGRITYFTLSLKEVRKQAVANGWMKRMSGWQGPGRWVAIAEDD